MLTSHGLLPLLHWHALAQQRLIRPISLQAGSYTAELDSYLSSQTCSDEENDHGRFVGLKKGNRTHSRQFKHSATIANASLLRRQIIDEKSVDKVGIFLFRCCWRCRHLQEGPPRPSCADTNLLPSCVCRESECLSSLDPSIWIPGVPSDRMLTSSRPCSVQRPVLRKPSSALACSVCTCGQMHASVPHTKHSNCSSPQD